VPNRTWRDRVALLGYVESGETGGGTQRAFRDTAEVHHAGYGSGYGGARPVAFTRASTRITKPVTSSELVYDVRRLFGLDPLPTLPPAPR
jgi:hypothetical protein